MGGHRLHRAILAPRGQMAGQVACGAEIAGAAACNCRDSLIPGLMPSSLKLGDRVMCISAPYKGRHGAVVRVVRAEGRLTCYVVRFDGVLSLSEALTGADLRPELPASAPLSE